ncbi:hypothetical protein BASA81_003370 [Batrachochytrium salamandrivorans]|nr:hypothetical protein BASA81_003370 [Batrachochytrium salamandrivorans]
MPQQHDDGSSSSVVPQGLNWLNVSETVQTSISALNDEAISHRADLTLLARQMQHMQVRIDELEEANAQLYDELERHRNDRLAAEFSLDRVLGEVTRLFKPELQQLRTTVKRLEQAAPATNQRLLTLEHARRERGGNVKSISQAAAVELKRLAL